MTLSLGVVIEQLWHRVPGGTGRATTQTLEAFGPEHDVRITGIAGWHRRSNRKTVQGIQQVSYANVPRPALYEAWMRSSLLAVRASNKPRVDYDVVWAASGICPPTNSPTVATVHDLDFLDHPEYSSRRGRSFFPRMWKVTLDRADIIVCPSRVVANRCEMEGVEPNRLRVIPWGVEANMFTDLAHESGVTNGQLRSRFGLGDRFALWVGTLEPRKNLGRLVSAVQTVPDVELAIVGPSGWNQDHGNMPPQLMDRVHFLGHLDDATLAGLYRAASVFVFPSLAEGFGLPVLEAMAAGVPVITSSTTATAEVAGDAAILVDPQDEGAIARAIESVLDNPSYGLAMGERGRVRAAGFGWNRTADSYLQVFNEALGS